jgi:hypothetical protein
MHLDGLLATDLARAPARSTLADVLNQRDWRIYHALALRLIARARELYAKELTGLELDATVYALYATTIDLCLSLFDWAPFRTTKAAVKMHTLLDLRGAIPAFIHISDGKVLDLLPVEAGAFYVMDRGYLDFSRLFKLHQAVRLNGFYVGKVYPEHLRRLRYKDPESGKTRMFLTNNTTLPPLTIAALYKSRWQVELFFNWIKQHLLHQAFSGDKRERGEDEKMWRPRAICRVCRVGGVRDFV